MAQKVTICIFAKPPRPGLVKSRLAEDIGANAAAAIADALLTDTVVAASHVRNARIILSVTEQFVFEGFAGITQWLQPQGDLGLRVESTLRWALLDANVAFALGADTPGISTDLIDDAIGRTSIADAVLGPVDDGGYYLLGLKTCPEGLLTNVRWSTAHTLSDTEARLKKHEMSVLFTKRWFDIDTAADLERARTEIIAGQLHAPCLASELTRIRIPAGLQGI